MENRKLIKNFLVLFLIFFIFPFFVSAYDDKTTHPALTDEIVDLFNHYYPNLKISGADKESVKKGSTDEDIPPRWMQHFYDPVYNRGLVLGMEWEKSKDWAKDTLAQAKYDPVYTASLGTITRKLFSSKTDYSWDRAVYEYAWGDKQKGLEALGHTLHLLEDATVPEHTRNDVHLPFLNQESFYEDWASQFTDKNFSLTNKLIETDKKPIILSDLNQYFDNNVVYSNNNFFSKDTIFDKNYALPVIENQKEKILSDGLNHYFGYRKINNTRNAYLVEIEPEFNFKTNTFIEKYKINDIDNLILTDYWNFLSEEAVLSGAGVVKLFFDDIEKEKNSKVLLSKNTSFFGKMIAGIGNIFSGGGSEPSTPNLAEVAPPQIPLPQDINNTNTNLPSQPSTLTSPSAPSSNSLPPSNPIPPKTNIDPSPSVPTPPSQTFIPSLPYPGFGGGSNPKSEIQSTKSETNSNEQNSNNQNNQLLSSSESDTTPPNSPVVVSPSDFSQPFTSASIVFSGTAEASSTISNDLNTSTTTADSNGNWSLDFSLNQGAATIKFFAEDAAGNVSSSTDVSLFVDSAGPTIDSFSISECSNSFSSAGCLIAATILHLSWQSNSDDLDYFELASNAQISTTTATSTIIAVADNSINNFSIKVKDTSGNWSEPKTLTAEISSMPVVINEVAWAGTQGNPYDEWIELYNRTNHPINLNNWILYSQTDNTPYIKLSKTIPVKGYYLLERTDDNTVSDILVSDILEAGQIYTGDLENSGEVLVLSRASTTIDRTPSVLPPYIRWAGGDSYAYQTMERISPDSIGEDRSSWRTNNRVVRNGKNADNQTINGTPKARNSVNYLISQGQSYISSNITLTKDNSPYLVDNTVQVFQDNATLTIEPGVVVKFYESAGFSFEGNSKIISRGEAGADKQIIFTSFSDDKYGGDLNGDATSTSPIPGNWYGVKIESSNNDSVFKNAVFRYGGKYYSGWGIMIGERANLSVKDSSVNIANSIFEYSKVYGLKLSDSNSTVSNNILRNNNNETDPAGHDAAMAVLGGSPSIQFNEFSNNYRGLFLSDSRATVDSNQFVSNKKEAIYCAPLTGFSNNSGSGNGINGIVISGNLTRPNETTTLKPNSLAYVLDGSSTVVGSSTLAIGPGIVIKGGGGFYGSILNVNGSFLIQGSKPGDIVFTSLSDSPVPGDWRGIRANPGSVTDIKGATFSYAETAISYYNSPIKLENVDFRNNKLAVWADGAAAGQTIFADQPISAIIVRFLNDLENLATTSPSGLWP